ncbi:hypothetical protein CDAR_467511 [Caerostris darwini]|uniref:Uncharacterized protein n=1 Tax=Caerostris darwini TaxID=1538125 RepID=A0AAV4RR01_9ARAC|nr:hypothetical protein CDAR_467511 [Caerostris darwini]
MAALNTSIENNNLGKETPSSLSFIMQVCFVERKRSRGYGVECLGWEVSHLSTRSKSIIGLYTPTLQLSNWNQGLSSRSDAKLKTSLSRKIHRPESPLAGIEKGIRVLR